MEYPTNIRAPQPEISVPDEYVAVFCTKSLCRALTESPRAGSPLKLAGMWLVREFGSTAATGLNQTEHAALSSGALVLPDATSDQGAESTTADYGTLEHLLSWSALESDCSYEHAQLVVAGQLDACGNQTGPLLLYAPAELHTVLGSAELGKLGIDSVY